MNAERLHAIAKAVRKDLEQTNALKTLQALRDALQNQVNQPNQAQHQQNVASELEKLTTALGQAPSNDFSPAWEEALEELGAADLLGDDLLQRIKNVFERNQITPAVALEEINELHSRLNGLNEAVQKLLQGFKTLEIGAEELEAGRAEVGFLIPREAVENELGEFGEELVRLKKTLGVFSEMASGERPGYEIRSISASDLTVFLELSPQVAACVALAVERVVSLYKQLLQIRKLRRDLEEEGVPPKGLKGVDEHASTHMRQGIEPLADELLEEFHDGRDTGRRNELRTELRLALNEIANRIDRGYNIEVRVEPLPAPAEEDEDDPLAAETARNVEIIRNASSTLEFIKPEGPPILELPEGSGEEDR